MTILAAVAVIDCGKRQRFGRLKLSSPTLESIIDQELNVHSLFDLLANATEDYIGEGVTQRDHALQAASLARQFGGTEGEVFAALFHDIGHLCAPNNAAEMKDLGVVNHEKIGAAALRQVGFQEPIPSLVELHVFAKRYLAWQSDEYLEKLSGASRATLHFQGGPLDDAEAQEFEKNPLCQSALQLRFWDESAKDPKAQVPPLDHYRMLLEMASQEIFQAP